MRSALKFFSSLSLLVLFLCNTEAALWTPAEVSLLRWYDASDTATITLVNTNDVSQWNAKVGATNLTQTTVGFRPKSGTRTINGLNTVEFDGTDDRMAIGATLTLLTGAPTKREIWTVAELDDTADEPILANTSSSELSVIANQLKFYGGSFGPIGDARSSDIGATPFILGFIGDTIKSYSINGTFETTVDVLGGLATSRLQVTQVGFRATGSALDGAIGEIIIPNGVSSIDRRLRIEGYLAWKWGLQAKLPSDHIYKNAAPTTDEYTLTFDSDGGSAVAPIVDLFGSTITPPADPTKEGYTFTGWSPSLPATMPEGNAAYTAQWTINSYTITFDSDGGSGVAGIIQDYGTTITAPTPPTKPGYIFGGWNPALPDTMHPYSDTHTALWSLDQFTITFDGLNGIPFADPITADFGATITPPANPTREGYTFTGWSPELPLTMPASNSHHHAQWLINTYTITYTGNGSDGGSAPSTQTADYDTSITLATNTFTRTEHTFNVWSCGLAETSYTVTADITCEAQWTINSYTITFDSDGGLGVADITQDYDTTVTPPADPTKEGCTFAGWSPALPATIPAGNATYTAQWTANQYALTFDTDGGSVVVTITQDYDTTVTPPSDPTKPGYIFDGWSPVLPTTMPAANQTHTAQWTPVSGGGGGGGRSSGIILNSAPVVNTTRGTIFLYPAENPSIVETLQSLYPTVNLTEEVYQNTCETNKGKPFYRKCLLSSDFDAFNLFKDSVLCEGFIVKQEYESAYRYQHTAPRKEVVGIAVKMKKIEGKHIPIVTPEKYKNLYTDIGIGEVSWIQPIVETALKYRIITKDRTTFEPDRDVTRAEAYAMIMQSVCMTPSRNSTHTWQQNIFTRAKREGLTSKTWDTYESERPILRQELFLIASKASDWAERTGGCDPKPEYCFVK